MNHEDHIEAMVEMARLASRLAELNRPEEEVLAEFQQFQEIANSDDAYFLCCVICEKKVTGPRYRKALGEGHIYSDLGRREFSMSKMCEWCFDKVTAEPEEEENHHVLIAGSTEAGKKLVNDFSALERLFLGEEDHGSKSSD